MSLAEYASRPFPVFSKLAVMLRNIPAMRFVLARVSALLRGDEGNRESLTSRFLGQAPSVPKDTVQPVVFSGDAVAARPQPDDPSGRETLIRRRWIETGIKMWNPGIHGAGLAALNIQGRAGLLPPKPGERLPGYDKLEFRLIAGRIVCESVVVDPPQRRK